MRQGGLTRSRNYFQVVCLSDSVRYVCNEVSERITENVGHLVLEILRCNQGVQKLLTPFNHCMNFATTTSQMSVIVEGLPQVIDRLVPRFCSSVNENTNFGLRIKSVCI